MPPLYEHVADVIQARVVAGVLRTGDQLPSIADLAVEFEVGQTTIKEALRLLRWRGIVRGQPGKATYIA
jgi:DNA-binding FadR family transcriptional regulator